MGAVRHVFTVTSNALFRVEDLKPRRIGWVSKFTCGVRIVSDLQLFFVTTQTCILLDAHHRGVTSITGQLDLIMTMRHFSGRKHRLSGRDNGV